MKRKIIVRPFIPVYDFGLPDPDYDGTIYADDKQIELLKDAGYTIIEDKENE